MDYYMETHKPKTMEVFFDTEFTGLHQGTTLISIGLIAANGRSFYAEFNDYDKSQLNDWLEENVIKHLKFNNYDEIKPRSLPGLAEQYSMKGSTKQVSVVLDYWLKSLGDVVMWSDCLSYDWVLFNNIFGTAFDLPKNIYYIPFDICTLFEAAGVDPDINREEFSGFQGVDAKHNSMHDAIVIRKCHKKLKEMTQPK